MNFENLKKHLFDAANDAGLEEYEIFYTSDSSISAETLKDEISAFAYGVSGGVCFRCVVDGKIGSAVKSFTVAGNFFELIKNIEELSNNVKFGFPSGFTVFGAPNTLIRACSVAGT